jgi:hypothetical protein
MAFRTQVNTEISRKSWGIWSTWYNGKHYSAGSELVPARNVVGNDSFGVLMYWKCFPKMMRSGTK